MSLRNDLENVKNKIFEKVFTDDEIKHEVITKKGEYDIIVKCIRDYNDYRIYNVLVLLFSDKEMNNQSFKMFCFNNVFGAKTYIIKVLSNSLKFHRQYKTFDATFNIIHDNNNNEIIIYSDFNTNYNCIFRYMIGIQQNYVSLNYQEFLTFIDTLQGKEINRIKIVCSKLMKKNIIDLSIQEKELIYDVFKDDKMKNIINPIFVSDNIGYGWGTLFQEDISYYGDISKRDKALLCLIAEQNFKYSCNFNYYKGKLSVKNDNGIAFIDDSNHRYYFLKTKFGFLWVILNYNLSFISSDMNKLKDEFITSIDKKINTIIKLQG